MAEIEKQISIDAIEDRLSEVASEASYTVSWIKDKSGQPVSLSLPNYEGAGWAVKWALISHNAHRVELRSAERALRGMYAKGNMLSLEELENFFKWYADMLQFYQLHLTFEEEIVFPLIKKRVREYRETFRIGEVPQEIVDYLKELPEVDQHVQISLRLNAMKNQAEMIGKYEPYKIARNLIKIMAETIVLDVQNLKQEETYCYYLLSRFGNADKDQKYLDRELVKYHTKHIGVHKSFTVGMSLVHASQDAECRDDLDDRLAGKWHEKFLARGAHKAGKKRRDYLKPLLVAADMNPKVVPAF